MVRGQGHDYLDYAGSRVREMVRSKGLTVGGDWNDWAEELV